MINKQEFINDFEVMRDRAELNALSNLSLEQELTQKQYFRFRELAEKLGIVV